MRTNDGKRLTRAARNFSVLIATATWVSCAGPSTDASAAFEPGDSNDAVVKMAAELNQNAATAPKTVQVAVTNGSSFALGEGAIALSPSLEFDEISFKALALYMRAGLNVRDAARMARLVVNVSVFVVPPVPAGGSTTILVTAPAGTQLFYAAKVANSTTDFVASEAMISFPNGASGSFQTGWALDASGKIARGNASVGATPKIAVIANDVSQSCGTAGNMARPLTLFADNFGGIANSSAWPANSGYDNDFNGDWLTDGTTARVWNPASGNPEAPRPMTTGFVKFLNVCPTDGSTIDITASIDSAFVNLESSATLVLYYFDSAASLIRVDANHKIGRGNLRKTTMFESPVPLNARRVAIVPMAYFAPDETGNIYFSSLQASYAPKGMYASTVVASDSLIFSSTNKQPDGWVEFGGDYYVAPSDTAKAAWVTLFNPTWGGDQSRLPPVDTGMTKRYLLPTSWSAGDVLDARVFAAATFTDASSFVRLRLIFNDSKGVALSALDSDRLAQRSYADLGLLKQAIPAGAVSVDVILNAYLGAKETSSFYAQNLSVNSRRLVLK